MSNEGTETGRKFSTQENKLISEIGALYSSIAMFLMPFLAQDAMLFASQAQACAEAHILLGRQHKGYMTYLKKLVTASAYSAMITAHAPIVIGLLINHGMLKMPDMSQLLSLMATPQKDNTNGSTPVTTPEGIFFGKAV